jgi:hypothetical protein
MKKKLFPTAVFLLSLLIGSIGAGFSNWLVSQKITIEATTESRPYVCYIKETGIHYVSVDKALSIAETDGTTSTIYVIPGTNPSIKNSHTIVAGDSLNLPYSGETYWEGDDNTKGAVTAEDSFRAENTYKKLDVFVSTGAVITNRGTINIGGVQSGGGGGKNKSGQTGGDYAQLTLEGTASIDSYGILNCYGYLRGSTDTGKESTGNAILRSGSTTRTLFAIREHRGGTIFSAMKDNMQCSPFNRFYIANIRDISYRYESGSTMYSIADLYTGQKAIFSAQHNRSSISMIGSDSSFFLNLTSGTTVIGKFISTTYINTLSINGGFKVNSLVLELSLPYFGSVSLSTGSVLFPLSWYFNITLNSFEDGSPSNVDSTAQDLKILPGSSVTISSGVTVTLKQLAVYDSFTDVAVGAPTTYQSDGHTNPGVLLVNGSLTASTSLGGPISVNNNAAILSVSANTITTAELTASTPAYTSTNRSAQGYIDSATNFATFDSNSVYEGKGQYWAKSIVASYTLSFAITSNGDSNYEDAAFEYTVTLTYNGTSKNYSITNSNHNDIAAFEGTIYSITMVTAAASISPTSGTISANTSISITAAKGARIFTLTATYTDNGDSSDAADPTPTFSATITDPSTGSVETKNISISAKTFSIRSGYSLKISRTSTKGTDENETITMNGTTYSLDAGFVVSANISMAITYDGTEKSSCLVGSTQVSLADGSTKEAKEIALGDRVMTFDFETGTYRSEPVIFAEKRSQVHITLITLHFDDGSTTGVINQHSFLDYDKRDLFVVDANTVSSSIGVRCLTRSGNGFSSKTITSYDSVNTIEDSYEFITAYDLNFFADNMLSCEGTILRHTFFDLDKAFKYDTEKKADDIVTYGLFAYDEFKNYMTKLEFDLLNGPYFKVAIGKGYMTYEELMAALRTFTHEENAI